MATPVTVVKEVPAAAAASPSTTVVEKVEPAATSTTAASPAPATVVEKVEPTASTTAAAAPSTVVAQQAEPATTTTAAAASQPITSDKNTTAIATRPAGTTITQAGSAAGTTMVSTMSARPPRVNEFQQSFWHPGSCSACLGAWCCHCFFLGDLFTRADDYPLVEKTDFCNPCCYISMGAPAFATWLARSEFRKKFGIKGHGCTDCCASTFCSCFVLTQMNEELKRISAAAPSQTTYAQPQGGMAYQPPQDRT